MDIKNMTKEELQARSDARLRANNRGFIMNWIILLLFGILLTLSGCSGVKPVPCTPEVRIQKEYIPVHIEIPTVNCDFQGEGLQPTQKLLECLILHKRLLDKLRHDAEEHNKKLYKVL